MPEEVASKNSPGFSDLWQQCFTFNVALLLPPIFYLQKDDFSDLISLRSVDRGILMNAVRAKTAGYSMAAADVAANRAGLSTRYRHSRRKENAYATP